jgi:hypothetical protein
MKKSMVIVCFVILCLAAVSFGANLANPAAQVGDARLAFGGSYYVNGSTITNKKIPMMMNRIGGRASFSPVKYISIGADLAAVQVSVEQYPIGTHDTIPMFDGKYGLSYGGNLKLTSPFLFDRMAFIGLANGNFFRSENNFDAYYGGKDASAAAGIQVKIPNFGFISAGPHIYYIEGENKSYEGKKDTYSNINNLRGWIAIDYFPQVKILNDNQLPYLSLEFTASPKIKTSSRVRVQEFSVAVSMGTVSGRLYGLDKNVD